MPMRSPNTASPLEDFFQRLQRAARRILMIDYDGTLAPFHEDPVQAKPYPGVIERLDAIMDDPQTQVVLVTGRWTRNVVPLLPLRRLPEIWGAHGWEQLRPDGAYGQAQISQRALDGLFQTDAWMEQIQQLGGRYEYKPGGLAIHWRGLAPDQIAAIQRLVSEKWSAQEMDKDLAWHDFDGGIELRAQGRDKGYVVDTVLAKSQAAVSAYLGDDATDEDAFKAIKGRGLSVLVRPEYRATAAEVWIRPPEELLSFLERWQSSCKVETL